MDMVVRYYRYYQVSINELREYFKLPLKDLDVMPVYSHPVGKAVSPVPKFMFKLGHLMPDCQCQCIPGELTDMLIINLCKRVEYM